MVKYEILSDQQLLDLLKSGDHTALTEIYRRYHGVLYSHAYRRFPDREEVRDIIQDLFIYVWNHREELYFNTGLPSYLYTAVRNRILNQFRNQKVRTAYVSSLQEFIDKGENLTEAQFQEKELILLVEKEVAALPAQMRLIFEMSRNREMSHNEIAEALNLSPHTVRTQIRNALRILRNKLGVHIFFIFF